MPRGEDWALLCFKCIPCEWIRCCLLTHVESRQDVRRGSIAIVKGALMDYYREAINRCCGLAARSFLHYVEDNESSWLKHVFETKKLSIESRHTVETID